MNAENLQQTIVFGIQEFLDRAQGRVESIDNDRVRQNRAMAIAWLRNQLADEIGPGKRFGLLPKP